MLMKRLPKEDYDTMVGACDIGMLFLDSRFTIPNFPSRILSYMQAKLPVLAVTDSNTDIGSVISEGRFGWWCESTDPNQFIDIINAIRKVNLSEYRTNSYNYLIHNYSTEIGYRIIVRK